MKRRWLAVIVLMAALGGALAALLLWWRTLPPYVARLLPDANGYVYFDLANPRRAGALNNLPVPTEDPEYQAFLQATGFHFERDLNAAAFAVHNEISLDGTGTEDLRFSEVFYGSIDRQRATEYLRRLGTTQTYRSHEVFYIPFQGRTVRVVFLDDHYVAASNTNDDAPLRHIIDQFAGHTRAQSPPMLHEFYSETPLGAVAWAIVRDSSATHRVPNVMLMTLQKSLAGSVVIASVRFITSLQLRVEAVMPTQARADEMTQSLNSFISLYHSQDAQSRTGDADVRAMTESLHASQNGRRVELGMDVPLGALQKLAR